MIKKSILQEFYVKKGKSMQDIAGKLDCSVHKVQYWMHEHDIPRRSISDAVYLKCNPDGDPFEFRKPRSLNDMFLFGLGIGLYWGEGTKSNKHTVRMGNTDPALIEKFLEFMIRTFQVKKKDFHFGLQIFSDMNPKDALNFWVKRLKVSKNQFQKVIVTKSGSIGTYRNKTQHGVLTLHYNNKKLRDLLVSLLPM